MRTTFLACAAAIALVSGCGKWVTTRTKTVPISAERGPPKVVSAALQGTVTLLASGELELVPQLDATCQRTVTARTSVVHDQKYRRTNGFVGWIVGGAYVFAGGIPLAIFVSPVLGVPMIIGGGSALFYGISQPVKSGKTRKHTVRTNQGEVTSEALACPPGVLPVPPLVATTPWGANVPGKSAGGRYRFAIDWKAAGVAGIDPLADDVSRKVSTGWKFSAADGSLTFQWTPDGPQTAAIVDVVGATMGIKTGTGQADEEPPVLSVVELKSGQGAKLRAGATETFTLTLKNGGRGNAYRVAALTKSDLPALHGLRFSFGQIPPGATVTRTVQALVPRTLPDSDPLIVITFQEAKGNRPNNHTQQFNVRAAAQPDIAVDCKLAQGATALPDGSQQVVAGRQVLVRCTIKNTGNGDATDAHILATFGRAEGKSSVRKTIGPGRQDVYDVFVPVDGAAQGELRMTVTAKEENFGKTAQTSIPVKVERQPCAGKLTRTEFDRKKLELAGLLRDGTIDKAEHDRRIAELVSCLE